MLERTHVTRFAVPFLMKRTFKWMPLITCNPFKTITLKKNRSMLGGVPFHKDVFLSSLLCPKSCVVESWMVANPFLFRWITDSSLERVSCHTCLLECIHLSSCTQSPLFPFHLTLDLPLAPAALECGIFYVVFHVKRNASHDLSVPSIGPPYVDVWCSLASHLFLNSILNVQRQQWLQLF